MSGFANSGMSSANSNYSCVVYSCVTDRRTRALARAEVPAIRVSDVGIVRRRACMIQVHSDISDMARNIKLTFHVRSSS